MQKFSRIKIRKIQNEEKEMRLISENQLFDKKISKGQN